MQVSEAELAGMTDALDELHRHSLPGLADAVVETRAQHRRVMTSRRGFLAGSGLVAGGLVLAACGSSSKSTATGDTTGATTGATAADAAMQTDLAVAALASGLENLAVQVYQAGIDAATAGKLGKVPPAVVTFAKTAQMQHKDHAGAWNAVLTGAGKPAVTGVDMTVKTSVTDPALAKVTDVAGLAKLALALEDVASATYLNALTVLSSKGGIQTTASIQPVEMQHAAILHFLLGQYPVPEAFALTMGARKPGDTIG
jgi:Ferritin-like domain